MKALQAFILALIAGISPLASAQKEKPEPVTVAAGMTALASIDAEPTLAQAAAPVEQENLASIIAAAFTQAPEPPVKVLAETPVHLNQQAPLHEHCGCCIDCTCGPDCQCKYPGECVLKASGKHIIWIHCPTTGAWRGYATPQCRDVREVYKERPKQTYQGGTCGVRGCGV